MEARHAQDPELPVPPAQHGRGAVGVDLLGLERLGHQVLEVAALALQFGLRCLEAATSGCGAREIDLLRYQLEELDGADVTDPDEDARLDAEETLLGDAVAYREAGELAVASLAGDEAGVALTAGPASGVPATRWRPRSAALDGRLPYAEAAERLHGVLSEVDDVVAEVRQLAESIDESPERLESIRERRQLLKNLCRKYGDDLAAVMAFHAETQSSGSTSWSSSTPAPAALDHERKQALVDELEAARAVGTSRRQCRPRTRRGGAVGAARTGPPARRDRGAGRRH